MTQINDNEFFITLAEARRRAGDISPATLYRWAAKKEFPAIHKLGPRRSAVISSELEEWLNSRPISRASRKRVAA